MTELGNWLKRRMADRGLTYNATAVYAGVGQATISDIINKGHIPRVDTLHRLADYFGTSRTYVLQLAGYLEEGSGSEGESPQDAAIRIRAEELVRRWRLVDRYAPEQLDTLVNIAFTQAELVLGAARADVQESEEKEKNKD